MPRNAGLWNWRYCQEHQWRAWRGRRGVNANIVHYWRSLYRPGHLQGEKRSASIRLLPIDVNESEANPASQIGNKPSSVSTVMPTTKAGVIYLEFPKVHLRIESGVDVELARVVLETLQR